MFLPLSSILLRQTAHPNSEHVATEAKAAMMETEPRPAMAETEAKAAMTEEQAV